jgi:hypothetical protein
VVRWVDRFGNAQLGAAADGVLPPEVLLRRPSPPARPPGASPAAPTALRRVRAFDELGEDEYGLLDDANGQLAVVARGRPAAGPLGLVAGDAVELLW